MKISKEITYIDAIPNIRLIYRINSIVSYNHDVTIFLPMFRSSGVSGYENLIRFRVSLKEPDIHGTTTYTISAMFFIKITLYLQRYFILH